MRGIDIIEAMGNIDAHMILDARRRRPAAPTWIKWVSMAACICCAVIIGILALSRIVSWDEEIVPEALTSTEESAITSETPEISSMPSDIQEVNPEDVGSTEDNSPISEMTSEQASEPETAASKNPPKLNWSYSGNIDIPDNCMEYQETDTIMTCYDPISRNLLGGSTGKVWWITCYTIEEFDSMASSSLNADEYEVLADGWYGNISPSGYMLAKDDTFAYILNTPTDVQFSETSTESVISYGNLSEASLSILWSILSLNDLTANPHFTNEIAADLLPSASVVSAQEHVNPVMESQLVTTDGFALGATPEDVMAVLGEPDEDSGDPTMSRFLRYGGKYYTFSPCPDCSSMHLTTFGSDSGTGTCMPLGFDIGTPLSQVLSYFGVPDAQPSMSEKLYAYDESHYATYENVAATGLVRIYIRVGEVEYQLSFNRNNCIYITQVSCLNSLNYRCPDSSAP